MLKVLFFITAKIPHHWARRLGAVVGTLMNLFDNKERHVARINIARCFPDLSADKQAQLVKKTLKENAKTLLEMPRILTQDGEFSRNLITEYVGVHHFHKALKNDRGLILIAPHLGNWEITIHYLNQFTNIVVMYDPPKQPFLNDIMRKGRQSSGATLVPADASGVRAQLKHLKKGGVIAILPDQVPGNDNAGVYAPFMGHDAFTMTLVNNLAKRSGAELMMTFAERLLDGKSYRLHLSQAPDDIANVDAIISATALNEGVTTCIKAAPTQYQWTYKRFKHQRKNEQSPYRRQ